jgi:hypothetical protein
MTASSQLQPVRSSSSTAASAVAIVLVAGAAILALSVAGITFIGMAIAFPIAVPVALQFHVAVSAADVAIAQKFAEYAWLFAVLGVASFGAAGAVAFKAISKLSPTDD